MDGKDGPKECPKESKDDKDVKSGELSANLRKFPLFRVSLSIFVVFHLFCALTVSNRGSSPTNSVMKVVEAYTSFSGFWSTWGFFAPNPGPQMQIEYQLLDTSGNLVKSSVWPELVTGLSRPDRNIRRISSAQYMVLAHPEAAPNMLIPFLCRQNPGIGSVRLTSAVASFPKVSEILDGTRSFGDDVGTDRRSMGYDFCPKNDQKSDQKKETKTDPNNIPGGPSDARGSKSKGA
jgi:hypothetical protein